MPKTHDEVFADFRKLLTHGFYIVEVEDGAVIEDPDARQTALAATKPWRGELWAAFNALELHMRPLKALEHEKRMQAQNNRT